MLPKALSMTNGTRPYKSAHGHDMSCPYGIKHKSSGNQTTKQAGSMLYLIRQQYQKCPVCNAQPNDGNGIGPSIRTSLDPTFSGVSPLDW